MDDFRDLMTAQMDDAEARFADQDFAALYGRGIVGRVRRRRTVRAASMGGGTMLTAGALAIGAAHLPVNRAVTPAGGDPCITMTPSATVSHHMDMQSGVGSWSLMDGTAGELIVSVEVQADGRWLVTHTSGLTEYVGPSVTGSIVIGTDDGSTVTLKVAADNTISEGTFMAPPGADDTTGEPTTVTSGDCVTQSPLPTPSALTKSPSPSPTLAARSEDVTSPFQCSFAMDGEGKESAVINVVGLEWVEPADFTPSGVAMGDLATALPLEVGSLAIPVVHLAEAPNWAAWGGGVGVGDPVNLDVSSNAAGPVTATGFGFVKVHNGVVVGTLSPGSQQVHAKSWTEGNAILAVLLNAEEAFLACPDQGADMEEAETYFVAGSTLDDPTGLQSEGPHYVWRVLDQP
jgi:hypothetical protein